MGETELKNIFHIIFKKWWVVLIVIVCTGTLGSVYTFLIVKPVYESDTTIYIGKNTDPESISIMYNEVLLNDRLVNDYLVLVKSRLVAEEVMKELNITDISYEKLAAKLDIASKKDTRLIVITATDNNPEFAKKLADKVAEVFRKKALEIMKLENIQIIDRAVIAELPAKPNKIFNITISVLIGFLLGLFIVLITEYFDDTIKTPEDITKHLDLPIIGTIPVFIK